MLRTIGIDLSVTDPVVDENTTIDSIGNSKVDTVRVDAKMANSKSQVKSKGKNLTKAIAQGSGSCFITHGAKQVFTKLRQAFIEILILYYLDSNCHIYIETNYSSYTIGGVLS